jgi:integrase
MSTEASQDLRARAAQRDARRKTKHRGDHVPRDDERPLLLRDLGRQVHEDRTDVAGALDLQASLRARKARGERTVVVSKRTVREVGEAWFEAERPGWRDDYANELRRLLDKEIFDEFGDDRVSSIGPNEIIQYDRKLRARGLSESGAANVCKPLRGLLDHAVLCGDIDASPYRQVPRGKLSSCNTKRQHHEWTTEQVETFIATAREFDTRKEARRKYADQVELMIRLGLRMAEASGLRFCDIDHEQKEIQVRRQFTKRGAVVEFTKTAEGRRNIPVTDELLAKLAFRQSFYALADDDFIFAEEAGGRPPSHSNFRRRLEPDRCQDRHQARRRRSADAALGATRLRLAVGRSRPRLGRRGRVARPLLREGDGGDLRPLVRRRSALGSHP